MKTLKYQKKNNISIWICYIAVRVKANKSTKLWGTYKSKQDTKQKKKNFTTNFLSNDKDMYSTQFLQCFCFSYPIQYFLLLLVFQNCIQNCFFLLPFWKLKKKMPFLIFTLSFGLPFIFKPKLKKKKITIGHAIKIINIRRPNVQKTEPNTPDSLTFRTVVDTLFVVPPAAIPVNHFSNRMLDDIFVMFFLVIDGRSCFFLCFTELALDGNTCKQACQEKPYWMTYRCRYFYYEKFRYFWSYTMSCQKKE